MAAHHHQQPSPNDPAYWVQPPTPWIRPKYCPIPTTRKPLTVTESPSQETSSLDKHISNLSVIPESKSKTFPLFPAFPTEIRLQIWSHAILALPGRIIPIREVIRKRAYFISPRPHPLLASINREARQAVFSILQPLFLPSTDHVFVSVNTERDIIMLCNNDGVLRPRTLTRLQKALGPRRREEHLHLAAEVEIRDAPYGYGRNHNVPNPSYDVIASMTQVFPDICHLTLVPLEHVSLHGVDNYRGGVYLESEEGFEGRVKDYQKYVNKEEYVRKRPFHRVWDEGKNQMVMGPEGPEIRWGCYRLVGGEKWVWDVEKKKGYWRPKREGEEDDKKSKTTVSASRRR
ncbi:hypothetical protein L207DRAFT_572554 [Hyaloscypha variabilis F]|uniref:2EXR domain-containing protein n=1 Tax=Hyaloscypha variabilis (strain UAMH 11265 / GT02V1 / F) TaxID=1149755 RepID=A0A2J6QZW5_HYAVF|nr:hypothetical protein L207DRAFT_572554 [Hyaloscypha variabilis F]